MEETKDKTLEEINLMFSPIVASSISADGVEVPRSSEKIVDEWVSENE